MSFYPLVFTTTTCCHDSNWPMVKFFARGNKEKITRHPTINATILINKVSACSGLGQVYPKTHILC